MCSSYVVKFYRLLRKNIIVSGKTHELPDGPEIRGDRFSSYRASVECEKSDSGTWKSESTAQSLKTLPEKRGLEIERSLSVESDDEDPEDISGSIDFHNESATSEEKILSDILRKEGRERTAEELEQLYEELVLIKALNHLSNSVKRELASVIFVQDPFQKGETVFEQGEEGDTWYIILKGWVHVVIRGKGIVTTLQEGDEFGQLALVNDAPRAATIIAEEDGTQFLQVSKSDFNRILRDVEANIVRLKEHGRDVLVMETCRTNSNFQNTVIEGCPNKMVEYLLETRMNKPSSSGDVFLDDFLLTHIIFMSPRQLIMELQRHFQMQCETTSEEDVQLWKANRERVAYFIYRWILTVGRPVFQEPLVYSFIKEVHNEISKEAQSENHHLLQEVIQYQNLHTKAVEKSKLWNCLSSPQPVCLNSFDVAASSESQESVFYRRPSIRPNDDVIFRVFSIGHTFCQIRVPISSTVEEIKRVVGETWGLKRDDLLLVELKSSGEKVVLGERDRSVITSVSLNGRIFITSKIHMDALTCLPEQERETLDPEQYDLQTFSTRLLAYHLTLFDWILFKCIHEYELIYRTCNRGRNPDDKTITSNLDVFLQRFNQIQFWVVSAICTTAMADKRTAMLRKFIKLALYCKQYQNYNGCFAIVMGLSNIAVTRLTQTWDKLPAKSRRIFSDLERLIEPSRNHRPYRQTLNKLSPPFIPFMPLILKDITFIQDGNQSYVQEIGKENSEGALVNFEKMHMIAEVLRIIRTARSKAFNYTVVNGNGKEEECISTYVQNIRCIDKQEILYQLSLKIQPRMQTLTRPNSFI